MQMLNQIRNIYCVGRNYRLHAAELGNAVPDMPMIFSKPTHSLVQMNGQEIILPSNQGEIHYETELVVHISQDYDKSLSLKELIDSMALGIDVTLRDVQSELKKKGQPWLLAKGFIRSAPITPFIPFPGKDALNQRDFSLLINGSEAQRGNARDMIFNLETIVAYCASNFGLGAGDLIFTGTPAGVGPVSSGDHLELLWGEDVLGDATLKLGSD